MGKISQLYNEKYSALLTKHNSVCPDHLHVLYGCVNMRLCHNAIFMQTALLLLKPEYKISALLSQKYMQIKFC